MIFSQFTRFLSAVFLFYSIFILHACKSKEPPQKNSKIEQTEFQDTKKDQDAPRFVLLVEGGQLKLAKKIDRKKIGFYSHYPHDSLTIEVFETEKEVMITLKNDQSEIIAGCLAKTNQYCDYNINVNYEYYDKGYDFYWLNPINDKIEKLEIITRATFPNDNSLSKPWWPENLENFLKTLKFEPEKYKKKFKFQNLTEFKISKSDSNLKLTPLVLEEYYIFFQKDFGFTSYGLHPYFFYSYQNFKNHPYTGVVIEEYVEGYGTTRYLLIYNQEGKKMSELVVAESGGDEFHHETSSQIIKGNKISVSSYEEKPGKIKNKKTILYEINENGQIKPLPSK